MTLNRGRWRASRRRNAILRLFGSALTLLLTAAALAAPPAGRDEPARPRIGLVLSGGGARGVAHVGVLKVLEQMHVPIDAIAGTSMGAVVGGLYASGLSAGEIESIVTSLDWQDAFRDRPPRADLAFRRKQEDQNFLVHVPLGIKRGKFLLPRGLLGGQKLSQALRRLTAPVAAITDFDQLPTPFRAVATDLETGEAVVMRDGDLTEAMRASMSAPGVFTPVDRDGRLLVDGGVAENLPIDVAKTMNVDILIVVDVGFPLQSRENLVTAPTISNQMLAILIRRNAELQKATLTSRDIVIAPPLGATSSFDFGRLRRSIDTGEAAARSASERLAALAMSPGAYAAWQSARSAPRLPAPQIDFVRIDPAAEHYREALTAAFAGVEGKPLDADDMAARVTDLYGRGNLETVDYRLLHQDGRDGVLLSAMRNSWGPNYVRFGLNLQDDFQGNSTFNAAARFVLTEITHLGAEWVWDLQVGATPRIATELYVPLSYQSHWFIDPQARVEVRDVPVLDGQREIAEYRLHTADTELDFGREFGNWGEWRVGVLRESGASRLRLGDASLGNTEFDAREAFTRFSYDRLDDINFPRHGQSATLEWRSEHDVDFSGGTAKLVSFNYLAAGSMGRNTAVFWASGGSNLSPAGISVRTLYSLGGFLNLSGLVPNSITGPHYGIARFMYYRKIGSGGEGFLNVPTYLGFSLEAGNVWQHRGDMSLGSARKDASVFLGLDTLFGPVYLGIGQEDGGGTASYLFLGRTF